jgi:uncharacterized protein
MFKNNLVLITGPTKGIGKDLAECFAREGADLIFVSRDTTSLESLKEDFESRYSVKASIFPCDLSRPDAAQELVHWVEDKNFKVDVLVNNAGYGTYGYFHEVGIEDQIGMIDLHIRSLTYLCHAFLKGMLERRRGGILNVASTGGFQAVPIENVYCATKAYVVNFTEALAEELTGKGLKISCLCPGPTQTPFFDTHLMKAFTQFKRSRMNSVVVAKTGFKGFKKGEPVVVTGLRNKLLLTVSKFAPRSIVRKVAKRMMLSKAA